MLERLEDRTTPSSISGLSPAFGPIAGGGSVLIYGGGFTGATAVSFGGVATSGFGVISATEIMAEIPGHAAGVVNVVVTAPSGVSPITSADQYDYLAPAAPAVTGVSPNTGTTAGGGGVYIYGSGFSGATAVTFGGSSTPFSVMSGTEIEAQAPAHAAGVVDVVVTGPGGASSTSSADQFTYTIPAPPVPAVTGVSPNSGAMAGGGAVYIYGSGFTAATSVTFGGFSTGFGVLSATEIEAEAPAHGVGVVNVVVIGPGGSSAVTSADQYDYLASTTTTLTSSANPSTYGQDVTLTAEVDGAFGGAPTGSITFMSGTTMLGTATLSPGGNGSQATLTLSTLPVSSNSITALYNGDSANASSTSSSLLQIVQPAVLSSLAVTSSDPISTLGQALTLTVTAEGSWGAPTGTATFFDGLSVLGTVTLGPVPNGAGATASLTISDLALGVHTITVTYSGDGTYQAATSDALAETVQNVGEMQSATTWTNLSSDSEPSTTGQAVTLTATVLSDASGTPTGTVTFRDGDEVLGEAAVTEEGGGAQAVFVTSDLAPGTHNLTAIYSGDDNFAGSTSYPLTQDVTDASALTAVTWQDVQGPAGDTVVFSAVPPPTDAPPSGNPTGANSAPTLFVLRGGFIAAATNFLKAKLPALLTPLAPIGTLSLKITAIGFGTTNVSTISISGVQPANPAQDAQDILKGLNNSTGLVFGEAMLNFPDPSHQRQMLVNGEVSGTVEMPVVLPVFGANGAPLYLISTTVTYTYTVQLQFKSLVPGALAGSVLDEILQAIWQAMP